MKIQCISSSDVEYDLIDSSVPFSIDRQTGELSSEQFCPIVNDILVRCSQRSSKGKTAYAKIVFDQICQESSIKQSNIDWINRIGEERRKRLRYRASSISPSVSLTILFSSIEFR